MRFVPVIFAALLAVLVTVALAVPPTVPDGCLDLDADVGIRLTSYTDADTTWPGDIRLAGGQFLRGDGASGFQISADGKVKLRFFTLRTDSNGNTLEADRYRLTSCSTAADTFLVIEADKPEYYDLRGSNVDSAYVDLIDATDGVVKWWR